jgi:RNA polymerase sigma-54 factor
MTPELRQAIAILQMSTLELTEIYQRELEENPFLEEKEPEEAIDRDAEDKKPPGENGEWLEFSMIVI